jgi:CysZ protein
MIINITKTIRSILTKELRGIITKCVLITLALVIFIISMSIYGLGNSTISDNSWIEGIIDWLSGIGIFIFAWCMIPVFTPLISGLFVDKVATHIENYEYHNKLPLQVNQLRHSIISDIKFTIKALLLNILILPIYFIPIVNIIAYYLLNSYLLGNEFFRMINSRYQTIAATNDSYKSNRHAVIKHGLLITIVANIPILNLITPIVASILMVHLCHNIKIKT